MSRLEETRMAMQEAQDRYQQAAAQMAKVETELQRAQADYSAAHHAYTDLLEQEVARLKPAPLQAVTPESGEDLEPGQDFAQIVRDFGSRHPEKRLVAQRILEKMGPKAAPHLLRLMETEGHKRDKRLWVIGGVALCFTGTALLETVLPVLAGAGGLLNTAMLISILTIFPFRKPTLMHRRAGEALAQNKDLRVVGSLIDALDLGDPYITAGAVSALCRLLPRMRASDVGLLSPQQMEGLLNALSRRDAPTLVLAILKALEQIGDSRALPPVNRLAETPAYTTMDLDIQREARACQSMLVDRKISGRAGETLLRASSAPEPASETLLRPVQNATQAEPEMLLRASAGDNPS